LHDQFKAARNLSALVTLKLPLLKSTSGVLTNWILSIPPGFSEGG